MKKILNVAEKPSAAKKIAGILSRGTARTIFSKSKYTPVYEFKYKFRGQDSTMEFTSVVGHVENIAFEERYSIKNWNTTITEHLFQKAQIERKVEPDKQSIVQNLQHLAKSSDIIILWLDCDREGEAIAFEVLRICQEVRPELQVFRAQFSALTDKDIYEAMRTLRSPDPNLADAVQSRQEIDLRIGAAFTRFQTTLLKRRIPFLSSYKILSYGPCQFPTLGFVVERWKKVQSFVPEPFWFISCKHQKETGGPTVEFHWQKGHLFDRDSAIVLFEKCEEQPEAIVLSVTETTKLKYKPLPLTTIALQKLAVSKLKLASHRLMDIAEKLYNKGFISYPRTDTEYFNPNIRLDNLIDIHRENPYWGHFAAKLLDKQGFERPRKGGRDDNAHPPIHPVRLATKEANGLTPEEWVVYELITRHFLACCSKDAKGEEKIVKIDIAGEIFQAKGLVIKEENWLQVYPYEKWAGNKLPEFKENEVFFPKELKIKESRTTAPGLLTEQELIEKMEKNGIGTDATIAEHIKTIQERQYAEKIKDFFHATRLGEALVEGYEATGVALWKPDLRAAMEENMTEISKGKMKKEVFVKGCLEEMEGIFQKLKAKQEVLLEVVGRYFKGLKPPTVEVAREMEAVELADYKIINDEDGICGNCNGKTLKVMENLEGSRIARCTVDNLSVKLPKKGAMRFKEESTCPLCSFQLMELKSEGNQRYTICPWCYSNPPEALLGDIEAGNTLMPCFKCPNIDCKVSGASGDEKALFLCEKCKTTGMVIRRAKNGKLFLGCKGFPHCKYLIPVPEIIKDIEIMEGEKCKKCPGNVTKAGVKFQEKQNLEPSIRMRIIEEDSVFCFGGCDFDLENLGYTVKRTESFGYAVKKQENIGETVIKQENFEVASSFGYSQVSTSASTSARTSFSTSNYSQSSVRGYLERYSQRTGKDIFSENSQRNEEKGPGNMSSGLRRSETDSTKVQCFRCKQYGHYAKQCTVRARKSDGNQNEDIRKYLGVGKVKNDAGKGEKYCVGCGRLGKHPKGSDCTMVKRKQAKLGK